jgi:hypothetical protein
MKLSKLLHSIVEAETDVVSYIDIVGAEIDGNQTKEKSLKLDAARVIDGSARKTFEDFITTFISGEINIKFVIGGATVQINTLKKDDKITFIEIELSALNDNEYAGVKQSLQASKITFVEEGKALKISNSAGYNTEQLVTLIINIIKIVTTR